jgi:5-methylthioribose kinase
MSLPTVPIAVTKPPFRLDATNVIPYLVNRGIIGDVPGARVEELTGGVSGVVLAVESDAVQLVVKQALARLNVPQEWHSDPGRIHAEADALRVAGRIDPRSVPELIDMDPVHNVLIMSRVPARFQNWKDELMSGHIDLAVPERLGHQLASWHSATLDHSRLGAGFDTVDVFVDLRIDPFYHVPAERNPLVAAQLAQLADRLLEGRQCLVHGDFSPKNVLVAETDVVVLDWEVAHIGDPAFDLAFMISHLFCKSAHRPQDSAVLRDAAEVFLRSYRDLASDELAAVDPGYLTAHTAALALARVDGKSPAAYLRPRAQSAVRHAAVTTLAVPTSHPPTSLWELL